MLAVNKSTQYRLMVTSRVLAAVFGGYALTSAATVLLARLWPLPQAQAVAAATMLSFVLYAVIILWIFNARHLHSIWLWLVLLTTICTGLAWPVPQHQAIALATMLNFILCSVAILSIFIARHLRIMWLRLVLSTAVCTGLAWLLVPGANA